MWHVKNRPYFIAEVSSNHHKDLDRCFAFIDKAAEIGCDAVKFQVFRIDQLFSPEVLARSAAHCARRQWELPRAFIPQLAERCAARNVDFCCTPFDLEAVALLAPHVAFYKIASYELLWEALLTACAGTGKPVVLSTGMADLDEIKRAVEVLRNGGCLDPVLLHCVSAYPTPLERANLAAIDTIRRATDCACGWSDHTRQAAVILRAVHHWGASVVEFHLDLDGNGAEYEAGHCWLPDEIGEVIALTRKGMAADGDGEKAPTRDELPDRSWRADPQDGLRPLKEVRATLQGGVG